VAVICCEVRSHAVMIVEVWTKKAKVQLSRSLASLTVYGWKSTNGSTSRLFHEHRDLLDNGIDCALEKC